MRTALTPEFRRIAAIERLLARGAPADGVELGIGDDAAVLAPLGRSVWTVDAQVEDVHFRRAWLSWRDVGYRAFQAAASDLAAMGAKPVAALCSLTLPPDFGARELAALTRGQAAASRDTGCPIVGGNLSKARVFSITTSLVGSAARPLLRSGARAGDELWLIGEVGWAALGLRALQRARQDAPSLQAMIARWRRPHALIEDGRALVGRARAAIDISDGLAGDAAHLASESAVRICFDVAALEAGFSRSYVSAAKLLRLDPIASALAGGEDYALLACGSRARRPPTARVIGSVERGRGVVALRDGKRVPLGASHDHFVKSR